ncbi:hypothetical protein [Burkholderia multivorans]|uniref:hypothetical protein n=1 Tax=Burkholderia multivorans TaxID=87883 RepID=UPI0021BF4135|nr:hypothetical protein [Burkholderia multivorans]
MSLCTEWCHNPKEAADHLRARLRPTAAPQPAQASPAAANVTEAVIRTVATQYYEFDADSQSYNILRYECEEDFFNCIRAILAAPQPAQADAQAEARELPMMRKAFRVTEVSGDPDPAKQRFYMRFSFPSIEALHAADDEWRKFVAAPVSAPADAGATPTHRCITCGAEGIPDEVIGCTACGFDDMQPLSTDDTAPPAAGEARLTVGEQQTISRAADSLDFHGLKTEATELRALLNGAGHGR